MMSSIYPYLIGNLLMSWRIDMTKQEAMAFAISVGKPIRHNSFSKGEFVQYKGKELVDEEGTILPQQEFWAIRSGGSWENGWEEYKED